MNGFVKHVFTFILWVTLAWIMYLVLFGTYSLDGRNLATGDTAYTGNTRQTEEWKGVLWNAALSVETPIAKYYHEFCLIPNVHANDYIDATLGGYSRYPLFQTPCDLSVDASDMYDVGGASNWSTGWQ